MQRLTMIECNEQCRKSWIRCQNEVPKYLPDRSVCQSYLKKRQIRIPRKYNPVGMGFFLTTLIPASMRAVDSLSSSRACICWFLACSSFDGTLPFIGENWRTTLNANATGLRLQIPVLGGGDAAEFGKFVITSANGTTVWNLWSTKISLHCWSRSRTSLGRSDGIP